MFVFGHSGISVGAAAAIDRRADLRWVPIFGLLPDLLDKPICLFVPEFANGWSRTIGHSLLGFALFSVAAVLVARRRAWIGIVPYALHLILDRMWREQDRCVIFWPFSGVALPIHAPPYAHWWDRFVEPWQIGGELVGLSILVALLVQARLWSEEPRRRFLATGALEAKVALNPSSTVACPASES